MSADLKSDRLSDRDIGPTRRFGLRWWRRRRRRPRGGFAVTLSASFLGLVIVVAIFADLISPYGYTEQDLLARLRPPVFAGGDWAHPMGTDTLGRDVMTRLFHAIRLSLSLALLGTLIGALLGTFLGFVAAAFRGIVEDVIMALVDFQASLPFLIIALAVLAFLGNSLTLFILLMGIYGWETYARLTRGMVISAQENDYIIAVRSLGGRPVRVYLRHIFPNIVSVLIVQLTLNFPETILTETSLSFLGLGIQPPLTSLGLMLGEGREYLLVAWWVAVLPGMTIFLTTLSMSILGDWLRDRLDPKLAE